MENQSQARQTGLATLLILLIILSAGASIALYSINSLPRDAQRAQLTDAALLQAKQALLGYAAGGNISSNGPVFGSARPGDLPCPDTNDDGLAELSCGNAAGTDAAGQRNRLGRLPWKTLGLPDLRDGDGERLWYAVSTNYKKNTRYNAALNSDTPGTISIRQRDGLSLQYNGASDGVIAVILAPGAPLTRATSLTDTTPYMQERSGAGVTTAINFLDLATGEDNADFVDSSSNGFIPGPIRDPSGTPLVNDRIAYITRQELAPLMEKRVAGEVSLCLKAYYSDNGMRLPWMATLAGGGDFSGNLNGYLPNTPFTNTEISGPGMTTVLPGLPCSITSNLGWWPNWKSMVTIMIAQNHRPQSATPALQCGVDAAATPCVMLNGAPKQFVVTIKGSLQDFNTRKATP